MRQIIRTIWILIYFFAWILLRKNEYLILVLSFLGYTFLIVEFLLERRDIRVGRYISVVKKKGINFKILFLITFGLLLVLWGLFDKPSLNSLKGIDSKAFAGTFFILEALTRRKNPLFLLTKNDLIFEGDLWHQVKWKYKNMDKVIIGSEEIQFVQGTESETFLIDKEDNELIKKISDFLLPKLENRLILLKHSAQQTL